MALENKYPNLGVFAGMALKNTVEHMGLNIGGAENIGDDGTPWMPVIDNEPEPEPEQPDYLKMFEEQQQAYKSQLEQMQLANQNQMQQMQNMFQMSMDQMTNQMSALRNPITPETKRPSIILGDSRSIRSMALR